MNSANNNIKISDGNKRNADMQIQTSPWISGRPTNVAARLSKKTKKNRNKNYGGEFKWQVLTDLIE